MDDPRIARLYVEAAGHPQLQDLRQNAYLTYAELVTTNVLAIPTPSERDRLAGLIFVTGATHAVIGWLRGTIQLSRDELIDEITTLALTRAT
jgi:hypothetical protein